MKAIQVKYLPCTNTKPSRLKAWTEGGQLIESYNHAGGIEAHARDIADKYIKHMGWEGVGIVGFGSLPNGDWVATLGGV